MWVGKWLSVCVCVVVYKDNNEGGGKRAENEAERLEEPTVELQLKDQLQDGHVSQMAKQAQGTVDVFLLL